MTAARPAPGDPSGSASRLAAPGVALAALPQAAVKAALCAGLRRVRPALPAPA